MILTLLSSFFHPFANPLESTSIASRLSKEISQPYAQIPQRPKIYGIDLKADIVFRGLDFPTSMAFLGPNDILVLEKNKGTVQRIVNGIMLQQPILEP